MGLGTPPNCTTCGARLRPRLPTFELATALACAWVGLHLGWAAELPAFLAFAIGAVALCAVDLRHHILPNWLVYPMLMACGALLLVAGAVQGDWHRLGIAAAAMVGSWLFYLVLFLVHPRGIGLGDVRLALPVGLLSGWVGWPNTILATLLAFLLGGVAGLVLLVVRVRGLRDAIPFGPFMVLGAALATLANHQIAWLLGS